VLPSNILFSLKHKNKNPLQKIKTSPNTEDRCMQNNDFAICFYVHEMWSLTLREGYKLRLFGNRVLRKILRPKKNEVSD
jgi:hypothetical protein